jgi:hypothetical protein
MGLAGFHLMRRVFSESMACMKSLGLLRFRMAVAVLLGVFFVLESMSPGFLPSWAVSRTDLAHALVALFGILWLCQAVYLKRELGMRTSK